MRSTKSSDLRARVRPWGMSEVFMSVRFLTSAFLMTCHWLNGAQLIGHRVIGDSVFLYAWKSADERPFVMVWCTEGHSMPLTMTFTDFFGREMKTNILGEEPVMIRFEKQQDPEKALDQVVAAMASKQPDADPPSAGR